MAGGRVPPPGAQAAPALAERRPRAQLLGREHVGREEAVAPHRDEAVAPEEAGARIAHGGADVDEQEGRVAAERGEHGQRIKGLADRHRAPEAALPFVQGPVVQGTTY